MNDHQALKKEQKNYKPIPVIRKVENKVFYRYKILDHYMVAVDATGVISSDEDRFGCGLKKDSKNGKITYLYPVLEAKLTGKQLHNNFVISANDFLILPFFYLAG